jgi:hypothetical protein
MKDFLRGTFGVFAQIVLIILGIVLIGVSCVAGSGVGILLLVLGILCFCAVAGIRYWLGHIVRMR